MYLERLRLDGKVAFATGGAQGIGYCCAEALAEAGARVTIGDRNADAIGEALETLASKGYDAAGVVLDVSRSADVTRVADQLAATAGRVDVLVNNAGIARIETAAEDVADEHWLNVLDVNLNGTFWCARALRSTVARGKSSVLISCSLLVPMDSASRLRSEAGTPSRLARITDMAPSVESVAS